MKEITPEKVVEILKEHGTIVTLEEAKVILPFMTNLATITLEEIFDPTEPPVPKSRKPKKDV